MQSSKRFIFINFSVWTFVLLLDFAGDYFKEMFWDRPFYWTEEMPFVTSWYIWFLLTPIAVYFSRKYLYDNTRLPAFIGFHFLIYLLLSIIQIALAAGWISFMGNWLLGRGSYKGILYKTAISGLFYNFIIYLIIVLIVNGLKYYDDLQQEKTKTHQLEKRLSESRMQFLKQQLQPHFLFNTHHSIITLMKIGLTNKAVSMMEKLSDLMRFALRENMQQEVPLQKELELLQLYVDIQKIRFEDKLVVEYQIEEHLEKALVPTMMLQPLIENAIKYAVETSEGETTITIAATKTDDKLFLRIKDEGSSLFNFNEIKKGIGISNTEERLQQLYGRQQHFELKPFTNNNLKGLEVVIKIPLHYV
jgi:sensor histidine kinase YesM